jgi:hypothetical protein
MIRIEDMSVRLGISSVLSRHSGRIHNHGL